MAQGRADECFRVAIATTLQVPAREVPDACVHARTSAGEDPNVVSWDAWVTMVEWAAARGFEALYHEQWPLHLDRWIGVCCGLEEYASNSEATEIARSSLNRTQRRAARHSLGDTYYFSGHCLVMNHGDLLFDPGWALVPPDGSRAIRRTVMEIEYGISFEPIKEGV